MRTHYNKLLMYPFWIKDFLSDPRVFHNVNRSLLESHRREEELTSVTLEDVIVRNPLLSLSFDIERDMTQSFESITSSTAKPFLSNIHRLTRDLPLKMPFFVQGGMVPGLASELNALVKDGHEIGLHGYNHELWGRTNWVTHRSPITVAERERRLKQALTNFEEAGLPRPTAFRAPNFTIDQDTFKLLAYYGFTVDSSLPTQRGELFNPQRILGICEVPSTCVPVPRIYRNRWLRLKTAAQFLQFNFDNYVNTSSSDLSSAVESTLKFQVSQKVAPHLVIYAHNWEFMKQQGDTVVLNTLAFDNLIKHSLMLITAFKMQSVTISNLANCLYQEDLQSCRSAS